MFQEKFILVSFYTLFWFILSSYAKFILLYFNIIVYLMGSRTFNRLQQFRRFIINVESTKDPSNQSPQTVGSFQLFSDSLSRFNEECVNTLSETNDLPKTEVFFMWVAPPPGSGCVTFKAMVLEDKHHWFADEGTLTKTFCEQTEKDIRFDENDCCACDEAKYSVSKSSN